ncbi:GAF domain-containing sensor histidine kinase [Mucilaginibacter calamicampi]|uniref:histidine kinase n=1 Tax=Mucilaginibacter calamicampi TaxID=1302352 RepID=A0ABW2YUJ1_9SPHI
MPNAPIPKNEFERIIDLSEYDLDYSALEDNFKDLAKLAANVAGTKISLVNLIDSFTQWSISNHGLPLDQMPREDSVCQYTIMDEHPFEVADLSADDRFKDKTYVTDDPNLRYYYGLPLTTSEGHNIGALCVLDKEVKNISPEKTELLKIIANEIVSRLKALKVINDLRGQLRYADETKKKVAHDIRGPLGGIIGLAQIISEQGNNSQIDEVLEFINLIQKSGRSILELADEILTAEETKAPGADEFNLVLLKDKLEKLYQPQALNKNIRFTVFISPETATVPFSKNKLLQIIGNLVSNAMKFTPESGQVRVSLTLKTEKDTPVLLQINVSDSGVGMSDQAIEKILDGTASSTDGTSGENGYGFGLALVKHLISGLNGTMHIISKPGEGATFEVSLPQIAS